MMPLYTLLDVYRLGHCLLTAEFVRLRSVVSGLESVFSALLAPCFLSMHVWLAVLDKVCRSLHVQLDTVTEWTFVAPCRHCKICRHDPV